MTSPASVRSKSYWDTWTRLPGRKTWNNCTRTRITTDHEPFIRTANTNVSHTHRNDFTDYSIYVGFLSLSLFVLVCLFVNSTCSLSVSVDLDRLYDDVKQYSCTPRNFSVNLREELKMTNAVFFPRCLLVQRCGGNCACGTDGWNSCTCSAGKTVKKLHEVSHNALQDQNTRSPFTAQP